MVARSSTGSRSPRPTGSNRRSSRSRCSARSRRSSPCGTPRRRTGARATAVKNATRSRIRAPSSVTAIAATNVREKSPKSGRTRKPRPNSTPSSNRQDRSPTRAEHVRDARPEASAEPSEPEAVLEPDVANSQNGGSADDEQRAERQQPRRTVDRRGAPNACSAMRRAASPAATTPKSVATSARTRPIHSSSTPPGVRSRAAASTATHRVLGARLHPFTRVEDRSVAVDDLVDDPVVDEAVVGGPPRRPRGHRDQEGRSGDRGDGHPAMEPAGRSGRHGGSLGAMAAGTSPVCTDGRSAALAGLRPGAGHAERSTTSAWSWRNCSTCPASSDGRG